MDVLARLINRLLLKNHLQGACWYPDVAEASCFPMYPHCVIPFYKLQDFPPDLKPHPIKQNVPYRLWSPVSNHLIQMDPATSPAIVNCSGDFGGPHSK